MNRGEDIVSLLKLSATAIATAPVFQIFSEVVAFPVFGHPVSLFMAGLFGAGLSLFFGDPIEGRRMFWGQIAGSVVFGVGSGVLVSDAMDWDWATKNLPLFVVCCSAMIRWFLPVLLPAIAKRAKKFIEEYQLPSFKKHKPEADTKPGEGDLK